MINYEKCTYAMNKILAHVGILDVIQKDSSIYVGGSLPSFIISQQLANKNFGVMKIKNPNSILSNDKYHLVDCTYKKREFNCGIPERHKLNNYDEICEYRDKMINVHKKLPFEEIEEIEKIEKIAEIEKIADNQVEIVCNDIDLYTNNYVKTLHNITKYLGNKIKNIKRTGVNVSFTIKDIPIQIITSEFHSFYEDVLGNYDCTLVSVGFYPYKNEFVTHTKFMDGLNSKKFVCYYEKSNPKRIEKLEDRAKNWFGAELLIIKDNEDADFRPYYKKSYYINSLQDIVSPPNYVQLYYNKFYCVCCSARQNHLLCPKCSTMIDTEICKNNNTKNKKITILGGVNGFGNIINQVASKFDNEVFVTSRNPPNTPNALKYELGQPISDELMNHLLTSDIIILNAYSTLENDETIWTTTIDTFDEKLAYEKFTINTIGYAKFLKEFVQMRKEQIKRNNLTNNIQMIFMDANESKFEGKLCDGKHLELNLAKTASKQIFYTNANLLASLGVLTMCFDICWVSWHGISIERIESKSNFLIPPRIAALCLLYQCGRNNFDECIDQKKVIFDCTTYQIIKQFSDIHIEL